MDVQFWYHTFTSPIVCQRYFYFTSNNKPNKAAKRGPHQFGGRTEWRNGKDCVFRPRMPLVVKFVVGKRESQDVQLLLVNFKLLRCTFAILSETSTLHSCFSEVFLKGKEEPQHSTEIPVHSPNKPLSLKLAVPTTARTTHSCSSVLSSTSTTSLHNPFRFAIPSSHPVTVEIGRDIPFQPP